MTSLLPLDKVGDRIAAYRRKQPIEELKRKADKAICKSNLWTQEELDLAKVEAAEMAAWLDKVAERL
jgi:hypothetical protein